MNFSKEQQHAITLATNKNTYIVAGPGSGKAQPIFSKILTPNGFINIGDIKINDVVLTPNGKSAKVTQIYKQGVIDIYKTTYSDNRTSLSCNNHLWKVYNKKWKPYCDKSGWRIKSTNYIINKLNNRKSNTESNNRLYIPLLTNKINTNNNINLKIHPYILGVMLGDGSFRNKIIKVTNSNPDIITKIKSLLPNDIKIMTCNISHSFVAKTHIGPKENTFKRAIREYGLLNCSSHNKFIPRDYMNASYNDRISLINGLLDTDGSYSTGIEYSTVSKQLALDMQKLIWSIGGICNITERYTSYNKKNKFHSYRVTIRYHNPKLLFSTKYHHDRIKSYQYDKLKLEIKKVEYYGKSEAVCIVLDDEENLYITDDYIITHNSTTLAEIARNLYLPDSKIVLITFTNKSAKDIIKKANIGNITGGTFHSIAYKILKAVNPEFSICDENKKRVIIKKIFDCKKDKELFEEIYDTISKVKSRYPIENCEYTYKYNEELNKYNMLDFDDIINHCVEYLLKNKPDLNITDILVDELQDTSQNQLELLKAMYVTDNKIHMVGVADLDQCHPAGNKILTTDGLINIEQLDEQKHKLPAYDGHGKVYGINKPYGYSFQKSVRKYSGRIIEFTVNNNKFQVTPNHKMYVKWNKNKVKNKHCLYIMRKGNYYRLGQCRLINDNGYFQLGIRARIEEADDAWILEIYDNKQEALYWEQYYSILYKIPTLTFKEVPGSKHFKQEFINNVYDNISENIIKQDVEKLLDIYKKNILYPFWSKNNKYQKQTCLTFIITEACNIFNDYMIMAELNNSKLTYHDIISTDKLVNNIDVYSLNVEKFHNYFCENILVSNCIYQWRGAEPKNVFDFIELFKCETCKLATNYRSVTNIVEHSRKLIEHNKMRIQNELTAYNKDKGIVHVYRAKDTYSEIDYTVSICKRNKNKEIVILYRNRLNKTKLEYELRKNKIEYKVNDSSEIIDRSAFRVMLSILKIASSKYDIYDLQEAAKGLKALGPSTINKIKALIDNNTEKKLISELIKEEADNNKRFATSVSNILLLQETFTLFKNAKLSILIKEILEYINNSFEIPKDILEFIIDMTESYKVCAQDIIDLCNDFGLDNNPEEEMNDNAKITLSTIHGYKGGEGEMCILPFCDWNFKPDNNTMEETMEAERRLFYVAMTRAKEHLYMTYSGMIKPIFIKQAGL